jgi:hypothetical protein
MTMLKGLVFKGPLIHPSAWDPASCNMRDWTAAK